MPDESEYQRLKTNWHNALTARNSSFDPPTSLDEAEEQTWNEWVDWVEENNLNYTRFDPRGPEGEQVVTVMEWVR